MNALLKNPTEGRKAGLGTMALQDPGSEELQEEVRYPIMGSPPQKCPKKRARLTLRAQVKENSQERNFRDI